MTKGAKEWTYTVHAGYLCLETSECTCSPYAGQHEQYCGIEPIMEIEEIRARMEAYGRIEAVAARWASMIQTEAIVMTTGQRNAWQDALDELRAALGGPLGKPPEIADLLSRVEAEKQQHLIQWVGEQGPKLTPDPESAYTAHLKAKAAGNPKCPDCYGDPHVGVVKKTCSTCIGTGYVTAPKTNDLVECSACKGAGGAFAKGAWVKCSTCLGIGYVAGTIKFAQGGYVSNQANDPFSTEIPSDQLTKQLKQMYATMPYMAQDTFTTNPASVAATSKKAEKVLETVLAGKYPTPACPLCKGSGKLMDPVASCPACHPQGTKGKKPKHDWVTEQGKGCAACGFKGFLDTTYGLKPCPTCSPTPKPKKPKACSYCGYPHGKGFVMGGDSKPKPCPECNPETSEVSDADDLEF